MNKLLLAFLFIGLQAQAEDRRVTCDYKIMGMPFSVVTIDIFADGSLGHSADITVGTKSHSESLTEVAKSDGELAHGWISQEDPNNALEMIIFSEAQPEGRAKMINPRIPFGNISWAECTGL